MKNIIGWFIVGSMTTLGHKVAKWLWAEVLEEKLNKKFKKSPNEES